MFEFGHNNLYLKQVLFQYWQNIYYNMFDISLCSVIFSPSTVINFIILSIYIGYILFLQHNFFIHFIFSPIIY